MGLPRSARHLLSSWRLLITLVWIILTDADHSDHPRPDLVVFLDVSEEVARQRGGFGEERWELLHLLLLLLLHQVRGGGVPEEGEEQLQGAGGPLLGAGQQAARFATPKYVVKAFSCHYGSVPIFTVLVQVSADGSLEEVEGQLAALVVEEVARDRGLVGKLWTQGKEE